MKLWRVFLIVSFLILPFAVVSESLAAAYTYNFNVPYSSFTFDPAGLGGLLNAGGIGGPYTLTGSIGSFAPSGGNGLNLPAGFTLSTGDWNPSLGQWQQGTLTLSFGTGSSRTFTASNLNTTYTNLPGLAQIVVSGFNSASFSPAASQYFHIGENGWGGTFKFAFVSGSLLDTSFAFTGGSNGAVAPVPIPPTLLLMVAGLVGLGVVRKRIK